MDSPTDLLAEIRDLVKDLPERLSSSGKDLLPQPSQARSEDPAQKAGQRWQAVERLMLAGGAFLPGLGQVGRWMQHTRRFSEAFAGVQEAGGSRPPVQQVAPSPTEGGTERAYGAGRGRLKLDTALMGKIREGESRAQSHIDEMLAKPPSSIRAEIPPAPQPISRGRRPVMSLPQEASFPPQPFSRPEVPSSTVPKPTSRPATDPLPLGGEASDLGHTMKELGDKIDALTDAMKQEDPSPESEGEQLRPKEKKETMWQAAPETAPDTEKVQRLWESMAQASRTGRNSIAELAKGAGAIVGGGLGAAAGAVTPIPGGAALGAVGGAAVGRTIAGIIAD